MAGARVGTKARLKDDKAKYLVSNGSRDEPDSSLLRRPIKTSITGFAQARKIFDSATEELQGLLTWECDLLYECRVCRNMFRSLANFISHKRVYCREKFNSSMHGHFGKTTSVSSEIFKIKQLEEGYQEFLKNQNNTPAMEPDKRVPLSRDLTAVVEDLIKHKAVTKPIDEKGLEVAVQQIPSSTAAVFQNLVSNDDSGDDMCTQVTELDKLAAKDKAVLKEDGKFEVCADAAITKDDAEPVIQISDDDDSQLCCSICNIQFSTRKTLKFHMKYKHVPDRLVYPCTECCDIFSTSWSVLRHLYKVHRKTTAQIRRVRELVYSRAFKMDNVPSSFVRRKNNKKVLSEQILTEEERMDQENQAWMDNMESDSEVPRCGGCGRSFERRAALAAHTFTCQSRTRALARKPAPQDRPAPRRDNKPKEKSDDAEKLTIKQMKPSIMEKEAKDDDTEDEGDSDEDKGELEEEQSDTEENDKGNEVSDLDEDSKETKAVFQDEIERANMAALRKKISEYVDKTGTQCKICKRKYTSPSHLCRHMSSHLNWRRFGCKICPYANYDRNRLVLHSLSTHKMKIEDDNHLTIIKALTPSEALEMSSSPKLMEVEEWDDVREPVESSGSSQSNPSSENESESSHSQKETIKPNRRKQTFKARKVKSKSSSPVKDDDKAVAKRPAQSPLEVAPGTNIKSRNLRVSETISRKDSDSNKIVVITDAVSRKDSDTNKSVGISDAVLGKDSDSNKMIGLSESASRNDTDNNKMGDSINSSRRPVRKRTRPKDEDFEYDFSNMTKWEGSSYRGSDSKATSTSRIITSKRKSQTESRSTETSPEKLEKPEKTERQEKSLRDEKPQKPEKTEEDKKRYRGALALMSQDAAKASQAHLRPSYITSRLYIVRQSIPFPVKRPPLPNVTPTSKVNVGLVKEDASSIKIYEAANAIIPKIKGFPSTEKHNKSDTVDGLKNSHVDVEKQLDEEIKKKQTNAAFKTTNVQALLQFRRQSMESKKNQVVQKQKVIVMKRINSSSDASQTGSLLKFPSINCGSIGRVENAIKSSTVAPAHVPVTVNAVNNEKKPKIDDEKNKDFSTMEKVGNVSKESSGETSMDTEECINISNESVELVEEGDALESYIIVPQSEVDKR